ncbi:MAG: iron-containing alcohol dehydrogenase [Ottowia sp.]
MPQRFLFGPVEYLGVELREWHTEGVLILASSRRHLDALEGALGGFAVEIFDGARVHVPAEVVAAAEARLAASGANTIVAIGGGSPIGLGKALRLARPELHFVAVPTTYAGSERTSIYGITSGGEKQTGRDPRVRPDLVVYDPELTFYLPIGLTTQSLCNAIAHVASVMSTSSLPAAADGSAPLIARPPPATRAR